MTSYVCKFGPLEIGMGGEGGKEGWLERGSFRLELRVALVTADIARMCAPIVRVHVYPLGTRVRVRRLVQKERTHTHTYTRAWNGIYIDHVYWWHSTRRERSILVLSKYCSPPPPPVYMDFCMCMPTSVYTRSAPLPFKVRRYIQYLFRGFILIGESRFPFSQLALLGTHFSNQLFERALHS